MHDCWLVALTMLKNMSSSMGMIIPYRKWKIKLMFQTTNQIVYVSRQYVRSVYVYNFI